MRFGIRRQLAHCLAAAISAFAIGAAMPATDHDVANKPGSGSDTRKDHTTINADLGLPDDRPTQELLAFLSAVLKSECP